MTRSGNSSDVVIDAPAADERSVAQPAFIARVPIVNRRSPDTTSHLLRSFVSQKLLLPPLQPDERDGTDEHRNQHRRDEATAHGSSFWLKFALSCGSASHWRLVSTTCVAAAVGTWEVHS
jgi:hypothetical protein